MPDDPIVDEVRRIRRKIAEGFNYDLDAIFADVRKREATSGHLVVQPPRKKTSRAKRLVRS
ncbi:MAG: hypothetical protein ACE15C_05795 [Phycisphaerae bacterium]